MHLAEALGRIDGNAPWQEQVEAWRHLHRTRATLLLPGSYACELRELIKAGALEEE